MSEFGYCPNDHKETLTHQHTDACYGIQDQRRIGPLCGFAASTPAQQFEAAAVQTAKDSAERYQARLTSEEAMKDSESLAERMHRFASEKFLQEITRLQADRAVLVARIEALEAEIDRMRAETVQAIPDMDRIAHTLKRFYFAELSMSSVQPIIALCLELNPDIIEQRR